MDTIRNLLLEVELTSNGIYVQFQQKLSCLNANWLVEVGMEVKEMSCVITN